jgi:SAM-dependent methyltransferase
VLELGAGTGRVALELAAAGHDVVAVEHDGALLAALRTRARARAITVTALHADVTELAIARRFGLCVAPMQFVQLMAGTVQRLELLGTVKRHLEPDGLFAAAVVSELEPFSGAHGGAPSPEVARDGEEVYVSRATAVRVTGGIALLERERQIHRAGRTVVTERDVQSLRLIGRAQLEGEGASIGLRALPAREIPATADHAGSTVVMLAA